MFIKVTEVLSMEAYVMDAFSACVFGDLNQKRLDASGKTV